MSPDAARARPVARLVGEGMAVALGLGLMFAALRLDQAWFEARYIGTYFFPRSLFETLESALRLVMGLLGVLLALAWRRPLGRFVEARSPAAIAAGLLRMALAIALALGIGELALRWRYPRAAETTLRDEPLRRTDPELGWVFAPARVGHARVGGRLVDYAIDAAGYRVAALDQPVDPARPSLLFAGESVMAGFGLDWRDTVPAQVAAAFRLQPVNMAGVAYADDQVYLRLRRELPRFAHPAGVVVLFSPGFLFRDFVDDRPHLEPGLVRRPAVKRWRLDSLVRFLVPYRSPAAIERRIALVRAELQGEAAMARARDACALVVVPRFGPETPGERRLRERILDGSGVLYVQVELDPAWRVPGDSHPDARGARAIADAVVRRLRASPDCRI